ncbi:conserved hypothetical protein [Xenorhabdus innexi]|uniref:Uncharacterized protein n=2 Tax=Xenorhabdus innexi TaxID=290109 RepID=A0A1N6MU96_9GAMM|nr:ABC-three component system middle component 8 [Xenorhabdus innexi]PHM27536.1 hypothetical protein Xinn_03958 [Xenorhabdus innexi]SIP72438.1 conserved hypothetical protein [Xenorhabdus innexi]
MIRPSKHSHPDRTVISMSLLMLTLLKNERVVSYGKLRDYAKKTINSGEVLFLPALNFLFLMGLIEYHTKIDSIEYVGPNETI